MDRLTSMTVFVRVAEKGSFTAVADELNLSSTMVANHVRSLEAQIGARLLDTTTRKQTLTEIGTAYLERCRDVLASVHAADHVAEALHAEPQGRLRVTAPVTWGTHRLVPVIAQYMATHTKVEVELSLNDRIVDLADEGFDCAIRSGHIDDEHIVARPLKHVHMLAAASPDYLKRRGQPEHPNDLLSQSHQLLWFSEWRGNHTWRFTRGDEKASIEIRGSLTINHGQALVGAALAGAGIVVQTDFLLEQDIAAGRLVQLFSDWQLPSRRMHIMRLPNVRPSAKIRSFVDWVVGRLGDG
jgi:DNA-binding transcriptional LysR family regulator